MPSRHEPDPTPPFLSGDLIRGWINGAISEEREDQHKAEIARLTQMHQIELQMRSLAGDGLTDIGSVGRLARTLEDFIKEQRESNDAAEKQRSAQGRQLGEIKQIPKIIKDLWKTVFAVLAGLMVIMALWAKFHPPQVKINPQQMEQLREPH
jgi:hypothetical protein